jgi:hypothetical protein
MLEQTKTGIGRKSHQTYGTDPCKKVCQFHDSIPLLGATEFRPLVRFVVFTKLRVESAVFHLCQSGLPLQWERLDGLPRKTHSEAVPVKMVANFHHAGSTKVLELRFQPEEN